MQIWGDFRFKFAEVGCHGCLKVASATPAISDTGYKFSSRWSSADIINSNPQTMEMWKKLQLMLKNWHES